MDEALLINIIGQLSPELLQDNYMEKDMKKGILSFLGIVLKKIIKQQNGNSFFQSLSNKNEYEKSSEQDNRESDSRKDSIETGKTYHNNIVEYGNKHIMESLKNHIDYLNTDTSDTSTEDKEDYNLNTRGLSISIFKKNIRNLIKVISGIAATFVVILSIIIILIVRHKSGIKLFKKRIQVIY